MSLRIDAQLLLRFQTLGMVALAVLLTLVVSGYFLAHNHTHNKSRLAEMERDILAQQRERLRMEMEGLQDYIRFMNARAEEVLMAEVREQVDEAYAVARAIYQQEKDRRPAAEVKALIRESLRPVRFFGGRGYIFIDDMDGLCILLPTAPQLEGRSLYDNQDDTGHYIMRGLIEAVSHSDGAGFSRYRWYPPGETERMADKIAYVRRFEPYDWIIGAGDYLYRIENDLKQQALQRIGSIRFGRSGYVAVLDGQGRVLASRAARTGLGRLPAEIEASQERRVVEQILATASQGGGFTEYQWYHPDGGPLAWKLSIVEKVPLWDWILVAGIYTDEVRALVEAQRQSLLHAQHDDKKALLWALLGVGGATLGLALLFSRWMRRLFNRYQTDIDRQQEALRSNARELEVAARVFEAAAEGIMVTDADNRILAVNRAYSRITGYRRDHVLGQDPKFMGSGCHDAAFYRELWQSLEGKGAWEGEVINRRRNGEIYPQWLAISAFRGADGQVLNYIATFTDITERKLAEERLHYLAEYDPLTDLPNRRKLRQRVGDAIGRGRRHPEQRFVLMFIDLDRFKNINDSLGHGSGDELLKTTAHRLRLVARETDTVSRLGGDEFVILMTDAGQPDAVVVLVERIRETLSQPVVLAGQEMVVTPSIGIACYPGDGRDFDTLLRNADAAMYHAKSQGRNNFQFFTREMNLRVSERLQLESALRQALANAEFELHYQAQYGLKDSRLLGCEALLRWRRADGSMVRPDAFIPVAEESGLIQPLGEWVLREACRQGTLWQAQGLPSLSIAVNVSAHQFRQDLVGCVQRALADSGYPARQLVLELTESALLEHAEAAARTLDRLKSLGVGIALDDFGTGYSSLSYLKRFPLDKLKIDRSFIDGLPQDADDQAITSSIIDIARHLGLRTVAEGIETEAQCEFLMTAGCDEAQGYFYARPLPAVEFEALLAQRLCPSG